MCGCSRSWCAFLRLWSFGSKYINIYLKDSCGHKCLKGFNNRHFILVMLAIYSSEGQSGGREKKEWPTYTRFFWHCSSRAASSLHSRKRGSLIKRSSVLEETTLFFPQRLRHDQKKKGAGGFDWSKIGEKGTVALVSQQQSDKNLIMI